MPKNKYYVIVNLPGVPTKALRCNPSIPCKWDKCNRIGTGTHLPCLGVAFKNTGSFGNTHICLAYGMLTQTIRPATLVESISIEARKF